MPIIVPKLWRSKTGAEFGMIIGASERFLNRSSCRLGLRNRASTEGSRFRLPQTRLSMRKLKEILRLSSLGLKQQQIARSYRIAQSTVHGYLKAAAAVGISWPLPYDWDDRRLEAVICGT